MLQSGKKNEAKGEISSNLLHQILDSQSPSMNQLRHRKHNVQVDLVLVRRLQRKLLG